MYGPFKGYMRLNSGVHTNQGRRLFIRVHLLSDCISWTVLPSMWPSVHPSARLPACPSVRLPFRPVFRPPSVPPSVVRPSSVPPSLVLLLFLFPSSVRQFFRPPSLKGSFIGPCPAFYDQIETVVALLVVKLFVFFIITWQGEGVTSCKFVRNCLLLILYLPTPIRTCNVSNGP